MTWCNHQFTANTTYLIKQHLNVFRFTWFNMPLSDTILFNTNLSRTGLELRYLGPQASMLAYEPPLLVNFIELLYLRSQSHFLVFWVEVKAGLKIYCLTYFLTLPALQDLLRITSRFISRPHKEKKAIHLLLLLTILNVCSTIKNMCFNDLLCT